MSWSVAHRLSTDAAEQDWNNRRSAAGVTFATDFRDSSDFANAHLYGANDAQGTAYWRSLVTQYSGDSCSGGKCLRIAIPNSTGCNGAAWYSSLNSAWTLDSEGFGNDEFYVSYRFKAPSNWITQNANSAARKLSIISGYRISDPLSGPSHSGFEHVLENTNWHSVPIVYRDTANVTAVGYGGYDAALGDIRIQDIDRGVGSNADRYCLYNGSNYTAGCWPFYLDEWQAFKFRIKAARYGDNVDDPAPGNIMQFWAARAGQPWTLVYNATDKAIGPISDGYTGGFCGIWLLGYETSWTAGPGFDTYALYDQLIASTQDIAAPLV